ncbi:hypothetical protein EJ04DRAFT_578210 [Polyplosphaeria fusca]|uniref:DUF7587 domain-containing protein n=1 Tax=Polyplosphaeria fusca TaxID=682080 RepID=A0A9P4QRW1_9PLEO|nr:hypothetical protein EJ04DRAFT_578210 [Polyplosphaeria fusca]
MVLDASQNGVMSNARRKYFEYLRNHNVPRYLFRAWSNSSGGGCSISINSKNEIIPPAFMRNQTHSLYSLSEYDISQMASAHYSGGFTPLSGFSSWAASLHLVLCYAEYMQHGNHRGVHVAVIDTHHLDGDVLVWHVPHLLNNGGFHEYLAHGKIAGRGYKAVPFKAIRKARLTALFPEISRARQDSFGYSVRAEMFAQIGKAVEEKEIEAMGAIAALFGHLSAPVAVALATLRPRPWSEELGEPSNADLEALFAALGDSSRLSECEKEAWLKSKDMVRTVSFPDVEQWIFLMRVMARYSKGRQPVLRPKLERDMSVNSVSTDSRSTGGKRKSLLCGLFCGMRLGRSGPDKVRKGNDLETDGV